MQSSAVGPQPLWRCSYTNLHRLLLHPFTSIRIQPFRIENTSLRSRRHRQTKLLVVSSSVGSPALLNWNVTHRHILALNLIASATILCTSWLFFYAIPALQALRKACDSLVNELDVAREQLPDAMAGARLSGAEISDLTMELSDLGQEITNKVRSVARVARVARVAEEKLRHFASMTATGAEPMAQTVIDTNYPPLANSVRGMKEGIVKTRSSFQMLISSIYYFKLFRKLFAAKAREKTR